MQSTEANTSEFTMEFTIILDNSIINEVSQNNDVVFLNNDSRGAIFEEETVKKCLNDLMDAIENTFPEHINKKVTRKRKSKNKDWLVSKRKEAYDRGKSYINAKHQIIPKKEIKLPCKKGCKFKCNETVNADLRQNIFDGFYSLDKQGKQVFISQMVDYTNVSRKTTKDAEGNLQNSKRRITYCYHFSVNEEKKRVCKKFYLGTLGISQKMVYGVLEGRQSNSGIPKTSKKSTRNTKQKVSENQKKQVRDHINSFPVIDSHYCRAKTNKAYLQPFLNISKMYDLYKEKCLETSENPVKESYYRFVFNTEFNIDFHKPKKDRCDICELHKVKIGNKIEPTEADIVNQNEHLAEKLAMREEKTRDKDNKDILIVVFDLQKVVNLPKADISSFYYKRKLNVYNLTSKLYEKKGYCAVWTELQSGRAGNDIASAFITMLEKIVVDYPLFADIVIWSDSCVPQNRNSFISHAIIEFMSRNPSISSILFKYSIRGHGCVQEVDNMHKKIDDSMKVREFFSPLSFLRLLLQADRKSPFTVIQMRERHFKDYKNCSKMLRYSEIPYTKVRQLKFEKKDPFSVKYKLSHADKEFTSVNIGTKAKTTTTRYKGKQPIINILAPRIQKPDVNPNKDKINDLVSMLPYMPLVDQEYYKSVLNF